jgi:aminocarboxymuconate-semialdehyde decarboxylase
VVRVVDAHAHVVVPGLDVEIPRSAVREFSDVSRILEEQDRAGVHVVVLCPWVNLLGREVERQNEALAALVSERVAVLGTVDLEQPETLVELMRDGRLSGVEVPAAPGGTYLGDEGFREFWAAAEETCALVFVHPSTRGFALPVLERHYMWNTVGNPLETTIAAADMIGAGVLDAHPRLRVLLAHGGGALPSVRGRLVHEQRIHPPGRDVRSAVRRFYVDTVVHDTEVLRGLVEFFGPEHVLLGSDYPFDMGVERPSQIVRELALDATAEAAILGGNALRLLRREVPAA